MEVWRVVTERHAIHALSGEGARRFGGRWNPKGFGVVYTSSSLSLAILEIMANTGSRVFPENPRSIRISIPDNISIDSIEISHLPDNWLKSPAPAALSEIGKEWLEEGETAVFPVPSAVVPQERNFLLNPQHDEFGGIKVVEVEELPLDQRLPEIIRSTHSIT